MVHNNKLRMDLQLIDLQKKKHIFLPHSLHSPVFFSLLQNDVISFHITT